MKNYKIIKIQLLGVLLLVLLNTNIIAQQDTVSGVNTEAGLIEYKHAFSEGLRIKMHGDINTAKEYFNRCLVLDPSSDAAMFELARIYFTQKEYAAAENYVTKALEIEPDNLWYKVLQASVFQKAGKIDNAALIYKNLISEYPDRYEYYEVLINMYLENKKHKEAIEIIEEIEDRVGYNQEISIQKEQIYISMGDYKNAILEVKKLIDKFPENISYYGILAEIYSEKGDKKNALKIYEKIKELDPDNGLVHMSLYQFYVNNRENDKAIEELIIAFSKPDIDVQKKIEILLKLTSAKNIDEELINTLTTEMRKVHPDEPAALVFYADLLIKEEKDLEARILLRKILKEEPGKFYIWQQLLFIENDLQDFKAMYEESNKALEYFPDQPIFLLLKGTSANQLKKYEEAEKTLNKGIRYTGGNLELNKQFYITLGDVYNNLGKYNDSDLTFDNLLALDPDNDLVLNNYSYYLALRKTKLKKAEEMILKCINIVKDNATYLDTYAWVLFQQGKFNEADKVMEKVMKSGQEISGEMYEHYGDILYMRGKKDEAIIQWKKAEETGEGSEILKEKIEKGILEF